MTNKRTLSHALTIAAVVPMLLSVAACGGSGTIGEPLSASSAQSIAEAAPSNEVTVTGHYSRAEIYGSIEEMANDSTIIVTGTAGTQSVVSDTTSTLDNPLDFTLADFDVDTVIKGDVNAGESIVVRQTGSKARSVGAPLLTTGGQYLLYLVNAELDGDQANQYYITGVSAGLFVPPTGDLAVAARGAAPTFVRVDTESGDDFPLTITTSEALG